MSFPDSPRLMNFDVWLAEYFQNPDILFEPDNSSKWRLSVALRESKILEKWRNSIEKMNFLRTPEDSTAVVRIMGEFDQFLTSDPRSRLTYEDPSSDGHEQSQRPSSKSFAKTLNKSRSQGSLFSNEREKDVELIKSRSKIAHLESQMNVLESERKRARIEFEKDSGNDRLERRRMEEKYEDLQKNIQYIAEQEKNAKDQLKDLKKEYETYRNKSEQTIQNLQREKLKLCAEKDEVHTFIGSS